MNITITSEQLQERMSKLQKLRDDQCIDGAWDHSPYMRGLANGLILAFSVLVDEEPLFKQVPERWAEINVAPAVGFSQQLPAPNVRLVAPGHVKFQPVRPPIGS